MDSQRQRAELEENPLAEPAKLLIVAAHHRPVSEEQHSEVELKENLLAVHEKPLVLAAKEPLPVWAAQHSQVAIVQPQAKPLERSQLATRPVFLLQRVRVCQCWTDRGPSVPVQARPVDQKYNRAVHCGVRPICDRYLRKRNRDGAVDCGNKCNRSPHKHGGRAQPCPISVPDKCPCLPHPFAD